jgi:hypothetical protein
MRPAARLDAGDVRGLLALVLADGAAAQLGILVLAAARRELRRRRDRHSDLEREREGGEATEKACKETASLHHSLVINGMGTGLVNGG